MQRVHVFISGKVQRVFFRDSIKKLAGKLSLKGFVRNLADSRLEAVFEGDKSAIAEMLELCKKGPSSAKVERLEIKEERPTNKFKNFEVVYFF